MRLWLDTVTASLMSKKYPDGKDIKLLQNLIDEGNTIVTANTAVDIAMFQNNVEWLKENLEKRTIIIEIWNTAQEMVSKPFYWSSRSKETSASDSFEEAIKNLEDSDKIMAIGRLIDDYGINRGQWECGEYIPPSPISEELANKLGIPVNSTRTDVLKAVTEDTMADYDEYNANYCTSLARQHMCDGVIKIDGDYKII